MQSSGVLFNLEVSLISSLPDAGGLTKAIIIRGYIHDRQQDLPR
jgi:hypothetical protein